MVDAESLPLETAKLALTTKPSLRFSAAKLPFGLHYSWVIIAILATVQIFASSISMAAGIMVPPLNDANGDFGWSLGTIGAVIASYYMFGAIYAPITGWLGDRYGSRWMLFAAAIMYLISMFLLGQVTEVWHFFIFFGVLLSLTQSVFTGVVADLTSRGSPVRAGARPPLNSAGLLGASVSSETGLSGLDSFRFHAWNPDRKPRSSC